MKKFYAFAAAALAAVSMNGQIYLCGNWDNDLGWNPANPLEFTQNADGNWEYADLHIQSFKISTVKAITGATVTNDEGEEVVVSDWDQFNGGALGFEGEFTKDMVGTPIELTAWGENLNLPWEGDWTFVVSADYTTLTCTTTTPAPDGFTDAYVLGGMNGWAADDLWKFETADGVTYTFHCTGETIIPAATEFKIGAANWAGINYTTGGEVIPDGEVLFGSYNIEGNMTFAEEFEGEIKLVLVDGQYNEAELYFTPEDMLGVEGVEIDANAPVEYFNLQGVRVANPENGLFIARQGNKTVKVVK